MWRQAIPSRFFPSRQSSIRVFHLALNANGTANSQNNPAAAGSVVTLFIDGLGLTSPPAPLNLPLAVTPYCDGTFCYPAPTFVSASPAPGSISGVTQVQLLAPANPHPASAFEVVFSLSEGPTAVRDTNLSFWVE